MLNRRPLFLFMLHKLLDDYDDEAFLAYAAKNLAGLKSIIHPGMVGFPPNVGQSSLFINPNFTYCACDYRNSKVSTYTPDLIMWAEEYYSQNSHDLAASINGKINKHIYQTFETLNFSDDPKEIHERLSLYDEVELQKRVKTGVNIFNSSNVSQSKFLDPRGLKLPSQDILLMSLIAFNFTSDLSNQDLMSLCEAQKDEIIKLTEKMP